VAPPPLPAEPARVDGHAKVDGHAQPAPERDARPLVLVVEDNAEIRGLICSHLRPHYATAEAGDGAEGLRRARELRPDLVLTDLAMPEVDGLELCRRIRDDEALADTPILLLTAHASNERRLEGLQTGANDFLTKPFSGEELLVRVRNLIRSREALQARYRQEVLVRPLGKAVHSSEAAFLARVYDAVAEHLADEAFSVPALAEAVGVSESQLKRRLRQMGEPSPVGVHPRAPAGARGGAAGGALRDGGGGGDGGGVRERVVLRPVLPRAVRGGPLGVRRAPRGGGGGVRRRGGRRAGTGADRAPARASRWRGVRERPGAGRRSPRGARLRRAPRGTA